MDIIYHAPKTELARNTRKIIRAAQQGQTVVIEHHGQPEVVILDIADYLIIRALNRYYTQPPLIESGTGLSDETINSLPSLQERYDLALAYYLAEEISLSRTAELLDIPWLDLRNRFIRLDIPLRKAPENIAEVQSDVANTSAWLKHNQG